MNNTNIATFKTKSSALFKYWLQFTQPLHGLTGKHLDTVAFLLYKRYRLSNSISDDKYLNKILFDVETKEQLSEELNIKVSRVHNILSSLRKKKIIIDNKINPKFIPNVSTNASNYKLIFNFEIDD